LVFSDYLKPALRLAALSKIPSMFVLSHDSIFLGEDGPTHQPVEHAWAIRLIPDVLDFRPADGMEVAMSWALALSEKERPSTLMLTRQTLPALERAEDFDPMQIAKGAYLLCELYPELDSELDESELDETELEPIELVDESMSDEETHAIEEMVDELDKVLNTVTLVGTGSEVALCVEVAQALCEQGIRSRVISMPSVKLFLEQDVSERRALLGEGLTVTVEAGSTLPWAGVVGMDALHIGIDHFGASAPMNDLINKFGFSSEQILTQILARLENA
jgi:transketolase